MSTTLSPQERDALVAQFDSLVETAPFQLLTAKELDELSKLEGAGAPVVSLYLDLGPDARRDRMWATVLKNLTREAVDKASEPREARHIADEGKRFEQLISKTLPDLGRSVAFFSYEPDNLLTELSLPLPLPNKMIAQPTAYLRPLFRELDEHDRFILVVIDDQRARIFVSQLGSIAEVADLIEEGPSKHSQGGWAQMRFQRHHDAHVLWHAGAVAHATALALDRFDARWLLVSGTPEALAEYRNQLSPPTAEKLVGEFKVSATASPSEVADAAAPVQREVEAREELATIERLRETPGGAKSMWGLPDTLAAVNAFRVHTLLVDENYHAPGAVCADCDQLTHQVDGLCPACGEQLVVVDDVLDLALERAYSQGAKLELVRSNRGREALADLDQVGALLRY